ncbi:hypothetical protein DFJ58DRAFT_345332 [Suillus subalutaceus]|uniref:uncharacterized protein n=1 Tax=Suillus subalutaceus TaxID=48586 RepID=UPI001B88475B|nr:uncharacterized protein DFJ58DRAFT_345332 [Suillus subalutaceus]KAG1856035.1 hypothetical protein DFJ58DRAFT_345332 [Suillus subalutaceus]
MDFSWSTPLRRNGQTILPLIPNEIYLATFECIAPTDQPLREQYVGTFSALALVCRFFCSVALPRVFERVTFSGDTNSNRTQASRKTKWARQIVANSEPAKSVALYVKMCTFELWDLNEEAKWLLFPFATLYCQAMARMSNIQKVVFSTSFVKKDHWEALAELKQLEVLEFRSCSFIEDPPDKELTVRTVMLFRTRNSPTTFTLRPIATTSIRSLSADDVEAVLKIVAFRQLTIDKLVLIQQNFDMGLLLHVFRRLPDLQSVTLALKERAVASSLPVIGKLPLKKHFTRLRSFTVKDTGYLVPRDETEMLISALCDGPGTLPSLEELNFHFITVDGWTTTLDIISDRLNGTIIPAFPNVRYINTDAGSIRLEEGDWKVHYSNRY